jgi:hypothetical protein
LLSIAVLPLAAAIAYADAWVVFGAMLSVGDIAEIVRNASPGSALTSYLAIYLALDPWAVGALALLTPLAVIAYGAWRLRQVKKPLSDASRAQ